MFAPVSPLNSSACGPLGVLRRMPCVRSTLLHASFLQPSFVPGVFYRLTSRFLALPYYFSIDYQCFQCLRANKKTPACRSKRQAARVFFLPQPGADLICARKSAYAPGYGRPTTTDLIIQQNIIYSVLVTK